MLCLWRYQLICIDCNIGQSSLSILSPPSEPAHVSPPGKREYLEICNVSNDTQDLGKVADEVDIRWSEP